MTRKHDVAIFLITPHPNRLNGTWFYKIEYFLFLLHNNIDAVFVTTLRKDYVLKIINDRYDIKNIDDLFDRIIFIDNKNFYDFFVKQIHYFNVSIVGVTSYRQIGLYLQNTKFIFLGSASIRKEFIIPNNCVFLNEHEEFGKVNYIKKIYFDIFKKIDNVQNKKLMHISNCNTSFINKNFNQILNDLKIDKNELLISGAGGYAFKDQGVDILKQHPENFFSLFDSIIYVNDEGFDYAPRLILESKFYDKKISMYVTNDIKGGFQSRMNNDYEMYSLKKDDYILQVINECLEK